MIERAMSLIRAQVRMPHNDRVLLGDVTGYVITPHGAVYLLVQHFNGEPWPVSPRLAAVETLDHTWPDEERRR